MTLGVPLAVRLLVGHSYITILGKFVLLSLSPSSIIWYRHKNLKGNDRFCYWWTWNKYVVISWPKTAEWHRRINRYQATSRQAHQSPSVVSSWRRRTLSTIIALNHYSTVGFQSFVICTGDMGLVSFCHSVVRSGVTWGGRGSGRTTPDDTLQGDSVTPEGKK